MNEIRDLIVGIDFGKEYSQYPDLFFYLISLNSKSNPSVKESPVPGDKGSYNSFLR